MGHNNDKGMYRLTGMRDFLIEAGYKLLADRGYSHSSLVTPDNQRSSQWNNQQKALRSVVETVIGLVRTWSVTDYTFRQSPELQELALLICYKLLAHSLAEYPLRA